MQGEFSLSQLKLQSDKSVANLRGQIIWQTHASPPVSVPAAYLHPCFLRTFGRKGEYTGQLDEFISLFILFDLYLSRKVPLRYKNLVFQGVLAEIADK